MDALSILLLAASGIASAVCEVLLWKGDGSRLWKLAWTPIVLLPVFGPVFFGGFYRVPSVQAPADRAAGRDWDVLPPEH